MRFLILTILIFFSGVSYAEDNSNLCFNSVTELGSSSQVCLGGNIPEPVCVNPLLCSEMVKSGSINETNQLSTLSTKREKSMFYVRGGAFLTTGIPIEFSKGGSAQVEVDNLDAMSDVIDGTYDKIVYLNWGSAGITKASLFQFNGYIGVDFSDYAPVMFEVGVVPFLPPFIKYDRSSRYTEALNTENVPISSSGITIGTANQNDNYTVYMQQSSRVDFSIPVEFNMYLIRQRLRYDSGIYDIFMSVGVQYSHVNITASAININVNDKVSGTMSGSLGESKYTGEYNSEYVLENQVNDSFFMVSPSIAFGFGKYLTNKLVLDFVYRSYYRPGMNISGSNQYYNGQELSPIYSDFTPGECTGVVGGGYCDIGWDSNARDKKPTLTIRDADSLNTYVNINSSFEHTFGVQLRYYF